MIVMHQIHQMEFTLSIRRYTEIQTLTLVQRRRQSDLNSSNLKFQIIMDTWENKLPGRDKKVEKQDCAKNV